MRTTVAFCRFVSNVASNEYAPLLLVDAVDVVVLVEDVVTATRTIRIVVNVGVALTNKTDLSYIHRH
jgi:hypothetical protein